jgi:hypothetical protein
LICSWSQNNNVVCFFMGQRIEKQQKTKAIV